MRLFILFIIIITEAYSFDVSISPIVGEISQKKNALEFKITNNSENYIVVNANVKQWDRILSHDLYKKNLDIIFNFEEKIIPPNGFSFINLLSNNFKKIIQTEKAYKLFVVAKPLGNKDILELFLELRIPIFIVPNKCNRKINWSINWESDNTAVLTFFNKGNVHLHLTQIKLFSDKELIYKKLNISSYIFPNNKYSVKIKLNKKSSNFRLMAFINGKRYEDKIAL